MPYDPELLKDLTDEEREALTLEDGDDDANADANQGADEADAQADAQDGDDGAAADADAAPVDADAADAADADPAPAADIAAPAAAEQPKEPAPSAPLLVIEAPADAAERLAAIAALKEEIAQKFDDGEITAKEFQKQLDAQNKAERDIEMKLHAVEMAQTMESQRQQREWAMDCDRFVAAHAEYADPKSREYALLNEAVMTIARMPVNQGLSNTAALEKAHRIVQAELGVATPAAPAAGKQAPAKIPRQPAPPNIGNLPQAAIPDASAGEFAHLDRLMKNPDAYEDALAKLSAAQRDRYLRA
jgi:hypothetical protein